jgi:hypothetical protein
LRALPLEVSLFVLVSRRSPLTMNLDIPEVVTGYHFIRIPGGKIFQGFPDNTSNENMG